MANLKEIKLKIGSVKNTQKTTKAMKLVSSAKLTRTRQLSEQARSYSRKINDVLSDIAARVSKVQDEGNISRAFIQNNAPKTVDIVFVTADKGLCGGFNMNIIRTVEDLLKGEYSDYVSGDNLELYCIGKKGADYFSKRFNKVPGNYSGIFSHLKFDFAAKLIADLKEGKDDSEYYK